MDIHYNLYESEVIMNRVRQFLLIALLAAIVSGSASGVIRSIFIWDAAAPGATFQHPDSTSTSLVRPRDGWIQALEAIQADTDGAIYGMRDTIMFEYGTDWPTDLNPFSIIIISMGWIDGSGPDDIDAAKQAQIIAHLDATDRTPAGQTAVILEGNDFAKLYCDTSASHYTYAGTFADYTGALLLIDDGGPPDVLSGEDSSLAQGMSFGYRAPSPAATSLDDIIINDAVWDGHHLRYLFNASSKSPARGIQRRSYSPGAVITLPFQFGNIPRGGNTKEQLLARMLDFSIMPLAEITTALHAGDTLFSDSLFTLNFTTYNIRAMKEAIIDYSTDGGTSWHILNSVPNPSPEEDFEFYLPRNPGAECYIRVTVHDSVFNSTSDTSAPFVLVNPANIDETPPLPETASIHAYPNPFNAAVLLDVSAQFGSEVEIYDIYGALVDVIPFNAPHSTVLWDAHGRPAGIYLAKVSGTSARAKLLLIK